MLVFKDPDPSSNESDYVARALDAGELVIVPTDTVYGIAARADNEQACRNLYAVKERDPSQPIAVIFPSVTSVLDSISSLSQRARHAVQALMPGPYTLVVHADEAVAPWLRGNTPDLLGIRVPAGARPLPPIAATSANAAGEPDITQLSELPSAIASRVSCAIDIGPRPAQHSSTVLDLSAWENGGEVRVIRDAAGRAGSAAGALAHA